MSKKALLLISDLHYEAQGRLYYEEDLFLARELGKEFEVAICGPTETKRYEANADLLLSRNTGPVVYYEKQYHEFRQRIRNSNKKIFNSLDGKADQLGKQYLLDLYELDFPVIPTVSSSKDIERLHDVDEYVFKSINGADSVGMSYVGKEELPSLNFAGSILQPKIDFQYELSMFYLGGVYQYSMYAPDKSRRWEMVPYEPRPSDLRFAEQFVAWNSMSFGVQRIDACMCQNGELLLVEVEDLNPYLSLLDVDEQTRQRFLDTLTEQLHSLSNL